MPYYNQRYLSELIKYDPLASDYLEEYNTYDTTGKSLQEQIGNREGVQSLSTRFSEKTTDHATNDQTAHSTDNITGNYQKHGDKILTTEQDRTEDVKEDITNNTLRTDNLTANSTSNTDTTTTENKNAHVHEVFSDLPQSKMTTTQTVAPDGTVTTTSTGYATTAKDSTSSETNKETGNSKVVGEIKNTGTVNTDSSSELNRHTTGTTDTEQKELWNENGDDTRNQTTDKSQKSVDQSMATADHQSSQKTIDQELYKNSSFGEQQNQSVGNNQRKGRMGISPANLIKAYRETFLNVDMEILRELEVLFMGVLKI